MNLELVILLVLYALLVIGAVLLEISIRVLKRSCDFPKYRRISRWGWRIITIAIMGISLHMGIFIWVHDIPTPWLP